MARNTQRQSNNYRARPQMQSSRYNARTLMHDRQYGFYWYAWLWQTLRPMLIFLISLVVVLGMILAGFNYLNNSFFAAPVPSDSDMHPFVIERGEYIVTIGKNLYEQGFIKNSGIFRYMVQFRELTEKIQFGTFPLSKGMNVNEVIDVLAQGSRPNEVTITIIPGWTIKDISAYLFKQGVVADEKAFLDTCDDAELFQKTYFPVADAVASTNFKQRIYALEGYLAPDTYRIYSSATSQQILNTLLSQSEKVLNEVFGDDVEFEVMLNENGEMIDSDGNVLSEPPVEYETTLSQDQTIILASIIEKEAGSTGDYRKVSAVLHNRLINGMRLECDSTVNYALGSSKLLLSGDELHTQSPYNTYTSNGLPAGPICNPSRRALIAARYPDMDYVYDGYLYFCSKDPATTNELQFSITKEEHEAAVAQYRPLWLEFEAKQRTAHP